MADTFMFMIAERILEKLGSGTLQQLGLAVGLKRELKKLEDTLATIKAVLLDAEDKQAKNRQLTVWLERLKDVCYDADDVLDEFAYEALRLQVVARGSLKTKVNSFFSHSSLKFRFVMGRRIKEIRERLDDIAINKTQFHLTERDVEWKVVTREREMTHSFLRPSDVIGRDTDKETIVKLLICQNIDQNFSVVPIVGIAGLGKTTIAKLVYNDERVNECFDLKMWVCVSDDFNLKRLTKDAIESANNDNDNSIDLSIDQLQTRLRNTLHGKKFLLVLDDVWNDDLEKWNELRQLLLDGANGSKIIATTRSHSVASIMGTVHPYILKGLPDKDCWSLFVKCAFKEGQERQSPNLEKIGKEIIKKCWGVPLAVRSLGSMLFMKTDEHDWLSIKENEIWRLEQRENDILPALKLSYKELPSYLKQCFAYCSIFPKDYWFRNYMLVQMWISQGFIQSSTENEELEDIGNRYIKELLSRCFFQDMVEHGSSIFFKMHDLVHDLALLVAQSECCGIKYIPTHKNISNRVRHVSICDRNKSLEEVSRFLLGLNNLRSIFFPMNGVRASAKSFVEKCITRFKYLRMLDLSDSCFEVLPISIGSLKHLRYLNLARNASIKKLPNSICNLYQLQILKLYGCRELEELPREMGNLISLGRLSVSTKQKFLHPDKGMRSLTSLHFLWIEGCPNLISLGEGMGRLTALHTLAFTNCENLKSLPRSLKYLCTLETLSIGNCEKLNLLEWEDDIDDLNLMSLQSLFIRTLPQLEALPRWIQGVSNTLKHLSLIDCCNLTTLPEWLQYLTLLQKLEIWSCPRLSALPEGMHRLTSLRVLVIQWCPKLNKRCRSEKGEDWHKISHIPDITLDSKKIKSSYTQIYVKFSEK